MSREAVLSKEKATFLFSAHISYGEGKYFIQTGFFKQNLPSTKLIFNFKGVAHRIQLT